MADRWLIQGVRVRGVNIPWVADDFDWQLCSQSNDVIRVDIMVGVGVVLQCT